MGRAFQQLDEQIVQKADSAEQRQSGRKRSNPDYNDNDNDNNHDNDNTNSNRSSKKRNISKKSSNKTSREKAKLKYPRISFSSTEATASKVPTSSSSSSHAEILIELIKNICDCEKEGLEEFFNDLNSEPIPTDGDSEKETRGRKAKELLKESMVSVLDIIPVKLQQKLEENESKWHFNPEYTRADKNEIKSLKKQKQKLEMNLSRLKSYSEVEDINERVKLFCKDYGINRNELDVDINQEIRKMREDGQTDVENQANQFFNMLVDIETQCEKILVETDKTKETVAEAAQLQDELYNAFKQVSQDTVNNPSVPTDTREIIRQLALF